jgi:hypothetical protein
MPFSDVTPAARSSVITGASLVALTSARAWRACILAWIAPGGNERLGFGMYQPANRASTRRTRVPHHFPHPVAVGMPCRFSSAAMPSNVVTPLGCISLMVPATSLARALARAVRTARAVRAASSSRSVIPLILIPIPGYRRKSLNRFGAGSV